MQTQNAVEQLNAQLRAIEAQLASMKAPAVTLPKAVAVTPTVEVPAIKLSLWVGERMINGRKMSVHDLAVMAYSGRKDFGTLDKDTRKDLGAQFDEQPKDKRQPYIAQAKADADKLYADFHKETAPLVRSEHNRKGNYVTCYKVLVTKTGLRNATIRYSDRSKQQVLRPGQAAK